jgi:hypothetical protein
VWNALQVHVAVSVAISYDADAFRIEVSIGGKLHSLKFLL